MLAKIICMIKSKSTSLRNIFQFSFSAKPQKCIVMTFVVLKGYTAFVSQLTCQCITKCTSLRTLPTLKSFSKEKLSSRNKNWESAALFMINTKMHPYSCTFRREVPIMITLAHSKSINKILARLIFLHFLRFCTIAKLSRNWLWRFHVIEFEQEQSCMYKQHSTKQL